MADYADFDLEAKKLARRRLISEKLLGAQAPVAQYKQFGDITHVIAPGALSGVAAALNRGAGELQNQNVDRDEQALAASEDDAVQKFSSSLSQDPTTPVTPQQLSQGMRVPALRTMLEKEYSAQLGEPRVARREQAQLDKMLAAQTAQDSRQEKNIAAQNDRLDKSLTAAEARAQIMASAQHAKAPSGFRFALDPTTGEKILIPLTGGPADPATKPLTETQSNANSFAQRIEQANKGLDELGGKIDPKNISAAFLADSGEGLSGTVASAVTNAYLSPEEQQFKNHAAVLINAVNRKESGAAVSVSEWNRALKDFIDAPNDSPQLKQQKANYRATVLKGMKESAGAGAPVNRQPAPQPTQQQPTQQPAPVVTHERRNSKTGLIEQKLSDGSVRVKPGQQGAQ